ncbi:MAG: NAD-dependent epimerase/dehydratase family protein [Minisyncoccia bacterium]|jgi:UDP-glucose 4-epimerase
METYRALVTGGLGLIGSAIVKKLLKYGHDIVIVDDLSAYDSITSKKLIQEIDKDIIFYSFDVADKKFFDMLNNEKFDVIFNFGSYSSDRYFERNTIDAINKTINGMVNVFNLARKVGAYKIIYPSSGTVYGNSRPPQNESQKLEPQTIYAITKIYCEMLSSLNKDVESVGMRIFTGYGAREIFKGNIASVVSIFTISAMLDKELEVYGDGSQKRDFIEVKDIAEVALRLTKTNKDVKVVNVGSGESYSFMDLINLIKNHTGKDLKIKFVENKTRFVAETRADITLLKDVTGYRPRGLIEMYPDYYNEIKKYVETNELFRSYKK